MVLIEEKPFCPRPNQRQLFLDDWGIEQIDGLERTLHQPDKRGAVIRSPDPSQSIQTRCAPVWDRREGCYKLWVIGVDSAFFSSPDGLNWTAGAPRTPEDSGVSMVVYDGADPDGQRRYKAALLDRGFAVSADGVEWKTLAVDPVSSSDEGNFSFDVASGRFIHTVKRSGPYGRSVAVATSMDFAAWQDFGVVFSADGEDQEKGRQVIAARLANSRLKQTEFNTPEHYSVQVYNMGVFAYEGLYIGLPSMYHHTGKVPPDWPGFNKLRLSPYIRQCVEQHGDYTGFYQVQVACSRNLEDWVRVGGREPFIETSPVGAGAYDLQTLIGPSDAVVRGEELWFYYTGIKQYAFVSSGGEPGYDDYFTDRGSVCLAVLRRDGFVSLDADQEEGTVSTAMFMLEGRELWVNVDAPRGQLYVEMLDGNNKVLARSVSVSVDQTRCKVEWLEGDLEKYRGQAVRLRFGLRSGRLYSYWFED